MTDEANVYEPPRTGGGSARWVLLALLFVALAGGGAFWFYKHHRAAAAGGARPAGSTMPERVVPVAVATVEKRDVPLFAEGLGNVVPIMSVTIKPQVDGRLDRVAYTEGQFVKKGDLLAQVDPRPFVIQLHTAEAALARDSATLRNAKLNLERYKALRDQKLIPQQQVDDQQTLADQTQAAVMADQAQADNARLLLDYARITSPIDGVTGVRLVDPGNLVHASDQNGIVVVTQLDPIAVVFTLPEDDLPRVSTELAKGPVPVEAYSRDGTQKLGDGKLTVIDNQINTTTATIKLKSTFDNPSRVLWPQEFIKARLLLATRTGAIVVPATVVQRGPQGTYAYVVKDDQTVEMRPIELDTTQGELALIAKGLEPGEKVVADGQNQLRPGAKISARPQGAGHAPPAPSASGAPAGSGSGMRRRGGAQ